MKKVSTDALDSLLRDKETSLRAAEERLRETEELHSQALAKVEQLTVDIADLKADLGKPL